MYFLAISYLFGKYSDVGENITNNHNFKKAHSSDRVLSILLLEWGRVEGGAAKYTPLSQKETKNKCAKTYFSGLKRQCNFTLKCEKKFNMFNSPICAKAILIFHSF